jgi:hypothetical protein
VKSVGFPALTDDSQKQRDWGCCVPQLHPPNVARTARVHPAMRPHRYCQDCPEAGSTR